MKSFRLIFIITTIVLIGWAVKVYAGVLHMRTYYPPPSSYVGTLKANLGLTIPVVTSGAGPNPALPGNAGRIWLNDT